MIKYLIGMVFPLVIISLVACSDSQHTATSDQHSANNPSQSLDSLPQPLEQIEGARQVIPSENSPCHQKTANSAEHTAESKQLSSPSFQMPSSSHITQHIHNRVTQHRQLFDWNEADSALVCQALQHTPGFITIGTRAVIQDKNLVYPLTELKNDIELLTNGGVEFSSQNERLGTLRILLHDCTYLMAIRGLSLVDFIDIEYQIDSHRVTRQALSQQSVANTGTCLSTTGNSANVDGIKSDAISSKDTVIIDTDIKDSINDNQLSQFNPGLYDPETSGMSYDEFVKTFDPVTANFFIRHNLHQVYNQYQYFGSNSIGVAVLDNGVTPDEVEYFEQGDGFFKFEGYFRPIIRPFIDNDGPHPQLYDFFGVPALLPLMFRHGTRQIIQIYHIAPHINMNSARVLPFPAIISRIQYRAVIEALMAMADDDTIRIASLSFGSIFVHHEMKRAIDYFIGQNKIAVAAAGSSLPGIWQLIGVGFPANLPTTISATGIQDTELSNGEFKLGRFSGIFISHGGPENDFVTDGIPASSESTSTVAGMIALLWSINPSLNRDEVMDILVKSSNFYRESGEKHPIFGWGKIDMLIAAELARETL